MGIEYNKIYHDDWINNKLPDKSVQLIIADPPYFEVKGDFDFIWHCFDDYLKEVEKWAIECKRLLSDNGTLFWYGHAKKIAYAQIIFDKYFNLENNIAVEFNRQTKKGVYNYQCFAPVSERILMYSNEINMRYNTKMYYTPELFKSIIQKLNKNITDKKICFELFKSDGRYSSKQSLQVQTKYKFGWGSRFELMDEKLFNICKNVLKFDFSYEEIKNEYQEIVKKHLADRRYFNNFLGLCDIMSFDQESHITKKYEHDTVKPEALTRAILLTCSRLNDLVFIPFAGSGTECAMSVLEGRKFIGYDIEKKYVDMSNKRVAKNIAQQKLFTPQQLHAEQISLL